MASLGLSLKLNKFTYRLASVATAALQMWHKMTAGAWSGGARLSDSSSNGNDAELFTGVALTFDGVDDTVSIGNTGATVKSIVFYVNPDTVTSNKFLQLRASGAVDVGVTSGALTTTGWTSPTTYVDGAAGSTITSGTWHQVVVTSATGVSADAVTLGLSGTTYYDGLMADVRMYSIELTAAQVAELYANPESVLATGITESDVVSVTREFMTSGSTVFVPDKYSGGGIASGATVTEKVGGPVWQKATKGFNKYLFFDQVDSWVDTPDFEPTGPYSMYFKFFTLGNNGHFTGIVGSGGNYIRSRNTPGGFLLYLGTESGVAFNGNYIKKAGDTQSIALRVKSNDIKLFVDGLEKAARTDITVTYNQRWQSIGLYSVVGTNLFKGCIYEAAFFDTELTDTEMAELTSGTKTPLDFSAKLWGYWKNETGSTWTDLSGNGRHGTVQGSKPTIMLREGISSKDIFDVTVTNSNAGELILNGDGYAQAADDATLDISSEITLEAWVKPFDVSAQQTIVGKAGAYALKIDATGKPLFSKYTSSTEATATTTATALSADTWYHVAVTYDGTDARFYINGALDTTASMTGAIDTNANDVYIGSLDGSTEIFKGYIDSVKVYNEAKAAADIQGNYNAEKSEH